MSLYGASFLFLLTSWLGAMLLWFAVGAGRATVHAASRVGAGCVTSGAGSAKGAGCHIALSTVGWSLFTSDN